jgi:hypothetical protein
MDAALSQKHLNISLMRLRIEVVYQEDGEVNFLAHNHSRNLGIAAHRTGVHAGYSVIGHTMLIKSLSNQASRRTSAY